MEEPITIRPLDYCGLYMDYKKFANSEIEKAKKTNSNLKRKLETVLHYLENEKKELKEVISLKENQKILEKKIEILKRRVKVTEKSYQELLIKQHKPPIAKKENNDTKQRASLIRNSFTSWLNKGRVREQ